MSHETCYDLRGPDFETYLVGPITDKIIDADRLVRSEWSNGFPNWALYRVAYAGDHHLRPHVRSWCVAYAIAAAEGGLVRKGLPSEEMGCLAGWDAYYALNNHKWLVAGQDIADVAGVDPKTYRKLRSYVYRNCKASLDEYFVRLQVAVRQVWMRDRWIDDSMTRAGWRPLASGEAIDAAATHTDGNGNYWVRGNSG